MTRRHIVLLGAFLVACGGGPHADGDAGRDAGGAPSDAAATADAAPDGAASGGCIAITSVGELRLDVFDDVGIRARARLMPDIDRKPWDLYIWFQRYGDAVFDGTITLGEGANDNFGTCSHCVFAAYGTSFGGRSFFADAGTMELRRDPFSARWDLSVRDARLVEVTIEESAEEPGVIVSTPVENGLCLLLPDLDVQQSFPPPEWRCERDAYADGETCDCACAAWDPDCDACIGRGTSCEIPIAGCAEGEICAFDVSTFPGKSMCVMPCHEGTCTRGTCVPLHGDRVCLEHPAYFDAAALGEACEDGHLIESRFCAVEGGVARGVCARWYGPVETPEPMPLLCRPACVRDEDCDASAFEKCEALFDGSVEDAPGYCIPRYPPTWSCAPAAYDDGTTCHCGCGVWDPDCGDPYLAPSSSPECEPGQVCVLADEIQLRGESECVTPPPNSTCETSLSLPLDAETTVTTRGASADYSAEACFTSGRSGFDTVHHVDLAAGDVLSVRATPLSERYDVALYLVGPGAPSACAEPLTCAAAVDDAHAGEAEELRFTAAAAGRYYLVLDSYAPRSGQVRLLATID